MRIQVSMHLDKKVQVHQILGCSRKINVTIAKTNTLQATPAIRFPLMAGKS